MRFFNISTSDTDATLIIYFGHIVDYVERENLYLSQMCKMICKTQVLIVIKP